MKKQYNNTDDFLLSENFNEFLLENSEKQQKKWDAYFEEYPETKMAAEQAKKIILGLDSLEDKISTKEISETKLQTQFERTWGKYKGVQSKNVVLSMSKLAMRIVAVAAVLVFVILFYSLSKNFLSNKNDTPEYFEVFVPTAEQSQISLPDGTKVWVNSETKIRYSNQFNLKERNILLNGEAYFEVAKNTDLPFCVMANGAKIKVRGTKFSVKGYSDEENVETVLVEGKIELSRIGDKTNSSIELEPGDKAILNLKTSRVRISREDVLDDVAWKDGRIMYRNVELQEVCKSLSRRYKAEITLSGDTRNLLTHPFTFTIENETLPMVLKYLCEAAPLMYKVEYIDEDGEKGIELVKYTISAR